MNLVLKVSWFCLCALCRTEGAWLRNAPSPCLLTECPRRSCPPFSAVTTAKAVSGRVEIMPSSNRRRSCITVSWERGEALLQWCLTYRSYVIFIPDTKLTFELFFFFFFTYYISSSLYVSVDVVIFFASAFCAWKQICCVLKSPRTGNFFLWKKWMVISPLLCFLRRRTFCF